MAAHDVLLRLARQALDRQRRAIQDITQAMRRTELRIQDIRASTAKEAPRSGDFMTTGATYAAFVEASKLRIEAANAELARLHAAYKHQLGEMQQQRVDLKRYERLAERRALREADEAAKEERQAIDDLVMIKLGHTKSAPPR